MALARVRSFSSFPGSSKESPNTKIAFNDDDDEGRAEFLVAATIVRGLLPTTSTWEQMMQMGSSEKMQIRAKEKERRRIKVVVAMAKTLAAANWP